MAEKENHRRVEGRPDAADQAAQADQAAGRRAARDASACERGREPADLDLARGRRRSGDAHDIEIRQGGHLGRRPVRHPGLPMQDPKPETEAAGRPPGAGDRFESTRCRMAIRRMRWRNMPCGRQRGSRPRMSPRRLGLKSRQHSRRPWPARLRSLIATLIFGASTPSGLSTRPAAP